MKIFSSKDYLRIVDSIVMDAYENGFSINHIEYRDYYAIRERLSLYGYEKTEDCVSRYYLNENGIQYAMNGYSAGSLKTKMKGDNNMQVTEKKLFSNKVFIVHGSNGELKEKVARIVESIGLKAIILAEKSSGGMTIIEKFEKYSDVGFAIAIMSKDDYGFRIGNEEEKKPRARQNVILELGFFIGKLGRNRILTICTDKDIEIPSDIKGMYLEYTTDKSLKYSIIEELKAAGYEFDLNKVLG